MTRKLPTAQDLSQRSKTVNARKLLDQNGLIVSMCINEVDLESVVHEGISDGSYDEQTLKIYWLDDLKCYAVVIPSR